MSYVGNDQGLKSERRNRLDGGLNARSSPLTIDPSASVCICPASTYRVLVVTRYASGIGGAGGGTCASSVIMLPLSKNINGVPMILASVNSFISSIVYGSVRASITGIGSGGKIKVRKNSEGIS